MICKKLKLLILSLVFILTANSIFAVEEYVSQIYKQLDQIFIEKSEDKLSAVLEDNSSDKYYYLIENYTEKKIRRLIVNNDYDFAMTAIIVVIDNNLENEQAVEMYTVIAEAYEVQQKHEAELEYQRQLELARIEKAKEAQRGNVEKEYVAATNASTGKTVYVTGKETKLVRYNLKGSMGLADVTWLMDQKSEMSTFHYGPALELNYGYTTDAKSVIGFDAFGSIQFLSMGNLKDEKQLIPLLADADLSLKYAPAAFPLFNIRAGFGLAFTGKTDYQNLFSPIADTIYSPTIGVKLENIPVGDSKFTVGADWLAGHLFYKNIKFAMGAAMNFAMPFAELEKIKLSLNIGLRDKVLVKDTGIENRASVILAIGAENVIR